MRIQPPNGGYIFLYLAGMRTPNFTPDINTQLKAGEK
jgi:hypothetical protein